ncbi:MAG: alpha/beta fold hydrolase [Chloroflexota bacterium]|nr:alpha/beta fold hydrolase [Chloroflexota bacterium]MDQ5867232.1 alpha/beta fold hydrolase [Chloroflexota bacterium]
MTQSINAQPTGADIDARSGYASVNGLNMYYEIHGTGQPLVLLHGAFSAIGTSFGALLPGLASSRQVIAFELQAHGRTADIDRPLSVEQMADDTAAALQHLGIEQADILGYSMGGAVALQVAIRHPQVVRKLVLASVTYNLGGVHPGLMDGFEEMQPEMMFGSPWHDEYLRIAPDPDHFATLFAKKNEMDRGTKDVPAETVAAIKSPTLIVIGDSDLVRPEHAVEMFRLLGGGVFGDLAGLPQSQLAILPGTTHVSIMNRAEWLVPMIGEFLDARVPDPGEAS